MKKILLLAILAVSLFSCNKEDNLELAVNQQQEQQKDPDYYYNLFINMTNDLPVDPIKSTETISTEKAGDHGDNWLEIAFFRSGYQNDFYANVRSEEHGSGCYYEVDEDLIVYTFLSATSQLHIETAGSSKKYNLSTDLASKYNTTTFNGSVNVLLALTDEGKVGTGQTPYQGQFNFSADCSLYELVEEAGTQLASTDGWYSVAFDDIVWEYDKPYYGNTVDTLYVNVYNGEVSYSELLHEDSFFLERTEYRSYYADYFSNESISSNELSVLFFPSGQNNPGSRTNINLQKSNGPDKSLYDEAIATWTQQTLFERFGNNFIFEFNGTEQFVKADEIEIHIYSQANDYSLSGCYNEMEITTREYPSDPGIGDNGRSVQYRVTSESSCGGYIQLDVQGDVNNYYLVGRAYEYVGISNCNYNEIIPPNTLIPTSITSVTICP